MITRSRSTARFREVSVDPTSRIPRPATRSSSTRRSDDHQPDNNEELSQIPEEEEPDQPDDEPDQPDDDPDQPGDDPDDPDDPDGSGDGGNDPSDHGSDRQSSHDDAERRAYNALVNLVRTAQQPPAAPKTKVREPDPFDGADSRKLRAFLVLCQLNFRARPTAYASDEAKVNYALSYLKGTALDWFEPAIIEDLHEPWMDDWSAFVRILRRNFGPADPVGDAEDDIVNLRMKDTQRIAKYNVDFNRLAALTRWDDAPLRHAYYRGLPARIKDILAHSDKPATLDALRIAAQNIDIRHWERRAEISREQPQSSKKSDNPTSSDKSKSENKKSFNQGKSSSSSASNRSNSRPDNSRTTGSSSFNNLSDILGKDGKLKPQERQRRIDNKLCLRCGKPDHMAKDCKIGESKGRSSKTSEAKPSEEAKK
jgi:hypothetical protein